MKDGKNILVEGANGTMLDIDHGSYPFVTSSNTLVSGLFCGLGLPHNSLTKSIGVCKAYLTRVGNGPMPTEINDEIGNFIREKGREYGVTTGRPRRCGWLDLYQLKYALMLNGLTSINLTKLDILDEIDEIKVCTGYKINGEEIHNRYPDTIKELGNVVPIYKTFKGWKRDTSKLRQKEELPKEAIDYIEFIREFTHVPVEYVGLGPDRTQMIH